LGKVTFETERLGDDASSIDFAGALCADVDLLEQNDVGLECFEYCSLTS
jgi:hypothetical protein